MTVTVEKISGKRMVCDIGRLDTLSTSYLHSILTQHLSTDLLQRYLILGLKSDLAPTQKFTDSLLLDKEVVLGMAAAEQEVLRCVVRGVYVRTPDFTKKYQA